MAKESIALMAVQVALWFLGFFCDSWDLFREQDKCLSSVPTLLHAQPLSFFSCSCLLISSTFFSPPPLGKHTLFSMSHCWHRSGLHSVQNAMPPWFSGLSLLERGRTPRLLSCLQALGAGWPGQWQIWPHLEKP